MSRIRMDLASGTFWVQVINDLRWRWTRLETRATTFPSVARAEAFRRDCVRSFQSLSEHEHTLIEEVA